MGKIKYETDCKYPFFISCKAKIMGFKSCEIRLENGRPFDIYAGSERS